MRTATQIADNLLAQYNGEYQVFDLMTNIGGIDFAVKRWPDCTEIDFEGSHDPRDWLRDFQAIMIQVPGIGGVEAGFNAGTDQVVDVLLKNIAKTLPVIIGGHSLGAAHAHIVARKLIAAGFTPSMVSRCVFGSPRPGDSVLAGGLKDSPVESYRNFQDFNHQDFVCDVPFEILLLAPFKHPGAYKLVNVAPDANDPWGPLARHHMELYRKALPNG